MRAVSRLFCLLLLWVAALPAHAAEVKVAVAANFAEPAREIATRFHARTGHTAVLSIGASGQFYAQIANGAPFGVFLSADRERPEQAEADGLGVRGTRFTYAVGRLALYSADPRGVDRAGKVLATGRFRKLAIADPKVAPYGQAALETLRKLGLAAAVQPKLVYGASIAQTYQFAQTGAADLGFVALSQVILDRGGSYWVVPASYHAPIEQQALLLTTARDNPAARSFLAFLKGPEARAIIRRYGYDAQ